MSDRNNADVATDTLKRNPFTGTKGSDPSVYVLLYKLVFVRGHVV